MELSSTRVLLVVKNPKKVHNFFRQVLENGNRVRYLTTASRTDLIAKMSAHWSGVGRYVRSGRLSVQSAYNHFPEDEGHDVAGKKSQAKSVKNTIVIICPTAVKEYFKTRAPKSVTTESKVNSIMKLESSVGD